MCFDIFDMFDLCEVFLDFEMFVNKRLQVIPIPCRFRAKLAFAETCFLHVNVMNTYFLKRNIPILSFTIARMSKLIQRNKVVS